MENKHLWSLLSMISLSAVAIGQQGLNSHLEIHVSDQSGAVVPRARVVITSSADSLAAVGHADSKGIAAFDLPAGSYELMVISRGFYFKAQHITTLGRETQSISAHLEVDACPGPGHPTCVEVLPSAEQESDSSADGAAHLTAFVVTDSTGEPISGAAIEASGTHTNISARASTDEGGLAELKLPPGQYTVSTAARFFQQWKKDVVIRNASRQNVRIEMDVDCGRVICGSS